MTIFLNSIFKTFIENILYKNFIDQDLPINIDQQQLLKNIEVISPRNQDFWNQDSEEILNGITILLGKLTLDLSDEFIKKRRADSDFHRYLIDKKLRTTFNTEISRLLAPLQDILHNSTKLLINLCGIVYRITLLEIYKILLEESIFDLELDFSQFNNSGKESKEILNYINTIQYKIDLIKFKIILRSKHNANLNKDFTNEKVKQIELYLKSINEILADSKIVRKIVGHYLDLDNQDWCGTTIYNYGTYEIEDIDNSFIDLHNKCKNVKEGKSLEKIYKTTELDKLLSSIPNNSNHENYWIQKKLSLYILNNKFSIELTDVKISNPEHVQDIIDKSKNSYDSIVRLNKSLNVSNYFHHYRYCKFLFDLIEQVNSYDNNNKINIDLLVNECKSSILNAKESVVWMKENAFNILTIPSNESNFEVDGLNINFFNGYIIPQDYDWILRNEIEPLLSKVNLLELQLRNIKKFQGVEESVKNTKEQIDKSTIRSIEVLSIFAAVSFFVSSSVSIFNNDSLEKYDHFTYILMVGSVLILFISMIKLIISDDWKKNNGLHWMIGISTSILLICLGLIGYFKSEEPNTETTTTIKEEYKSEKKTELSVPVKTLPDSTKK